ncbi:MAG TPA: hypothetical protein VGL61_05220 [Kofleriaceae bacterium]|jgi:hypothetical protein
MTYLCEVLRPAYELWTRSFKFVRYFYGPYSSELLGYLDYLVFHGLVSVRSYARADTGVVALYEASDEGLRASDQLMETDGGQTLRALAEDVVWSLQVLGVRTAKQICDVVYSEPQFESVLRDAEVRGIPSSSAEPLLSSQDPRHPAFRIQAILRSQASGVTPRQLVESYLRYLALRAKSPSLRQAETNA